MTIFIDRWLKWVNNINLFQSVMSCSQQIVTRRPINIGQQNTKIHTINM